MAAVALVEPQMAEKAAQAPMVAIARPPRICPKNLWAELNRRPLIPEWKPPAHEHEQGDDRQVVGAEDGKDIPGHEIQGRIPGNEDPEADESHDRHRETDGDPQEHQQDKQNETCNSGGDGCHDNTTLLTKRTRSTIKTQQRRAQPMAIPQANGEIGMARVRDTSPLACRSRA